MPDTGLDEIDNLGRRVTKYREILGINRYELAMRADLDPKLIRLIESGQASNPTLKTILRLSEALQISLFQLLGKEPPPRL